MTSHGFIGGSRRSNKEKIAEAIYREAEKVGTKKITIHFFKKSETPENRPDTLVEFDCHNLDGTANVERVNALATALNENVTDVTWGEPLIIEEAGYKRF